jgi:quaternary ammonium compound-resistance protein SugE
MSPQIAWVALVTAGILDVGWAIAMKYAEAIRARLEHRFAGLAGGVRVPARRALQVLEIGVPTRSGPASARSAP